MLEVCVDSIESAKNAIQGGAKRLELCSALSEGGLTPTVGLAKSVKSLSGTVPVYSMIRIRSGDFVYSREEADAMLDDVTALKETGVDGFVFGALKEDGSVDEDICRRVFVRAIPFPVTFHRAFDDASTNPAETMETIIKLGYERILTSGRKATAEEGLDCISELISHSKGRIAVMPGGGITENNLELIRSTSGAKEFHASGKKNNSAGSYGTKDKLFGNEKRIITDLNVVQKMVHILNQWKC